MNRITKALILSTVYASIASAQFSAAGDSVYTTPAKPTTKDSITYNFYDSDACCCAQFVNPTVHIQDTEVILYFSVNTTPCPCACIAAGAWYAFKGGPLKAGRYGIYRNEFIYCADMLCPPFVLPPVRIGEVVVTNPTSVGQGAPGIVPLSGLVVTQERSTINASYILNQPGRIRVNVFNARGVLAGEIYNRQTATGTQRFSWTAAAPGIYFMAVEINGAAAGSRKIIITQ